MLDGQASEEGKWEEGGPAPKTCSQLRCHVVAAVRLKRLLAIDGVY